MTISNQTNGAFRNQLELYTTESRNWFDDYFESNKFGAFRNQLELYTTESHETANLMTKILQRNLNDYFQSNLEHLEIS